MHFVILIKGYFCFCVSTFASWGTQKAEPVFTYSLGSSHGGLAFSDICSVSVDSSLGQYFCLGSTGHQNATVAATCKGYLNMEGLR